MNKNILQQIHSTTVQVLEKRMENWAESMIISPGTKEHGGILWDGSGLVHTAWHDKGSLSFIPKALALWREPLSKFYHDSSWLEKIDLAIDFISRNLPKSGLISMIYCNFSSPADTGFAMYGFCPIVELLRKDDHPYLDQFLPKLEGLTKRIGSGLIEGGIHTPNHRWSNVQGLGWVWKLFGNKKAKEYAELWLKEGIDISSDGEYLERSMNYSNHSNRSLMSAAYTLEKLELLDAPRKNLYLLPFLVHPDDNCVTDLSERNDAGIDVHISRFLESAYLFHAFEPSPFSAMLLQKCSETFIQSCSDDESYLTPATADLLPWIQLFPPEKLTWPEPEKWPVDYVKEFGDKKIQNERLCETKKFILPYKKDLSLLGSHPTFGASFVRIRHYKFSATLLTFNNSIVSLRYGNARLLGIYCSLSYFGLGPIFASELISHEDHWEIKRSELKAAFMGPLKNPPKHLDMERDNRQALNINRLNWSAEIREVTNGLKFFFRCSGAIEETGDELPVLAQIILQFPQEGNISGDYLTKENLPNVQLPGYVKVPTSNDLYFHKGSIVYENKGDSIIVNEGALQHRMPITILDP